MDWSVGIHKEARQSYSWTKIFDQHVQSLIQEMYALPSRETGGVCAVSLFHLSMNNIKKTCFKNIIQYFSMYEK